MILSKLGLGKAGPVMNGVALFNGGVGYEAGSLLEGLILGNIQSLIMF